MQDVLWAALDTAAAWVLTLRRSLIHTPRALMPDCGVTCVVYRRMSVVFCLCRLVDVIGSNCISSDFVGC